jgi:hypothetical protein
MPNAAAAAVVEYFALEGAAAAIATFVVELVVTVAINYGLSELSKEWAGKAKRNGYGNPQGAVRDVTVRGTVEPMQIVYGEVRTPGFLAFMGCSGTNNKYLHMVVVFAAHQIDSYQTFLVDGRPFNYSDIDGSGNVGSANFTDTASRLCAFTHLGTKGQTVDTTLNTAFPTDWDSNHRGAGVAYVHFRLEYSEKVWPNGAPGNYFAVIRGRKVYDPRLDSTNGGSGSHRYTNATTWAWSQNWALCVRDYISGGSRWYDVSTPEPRLGFGESNSRIDDSYVITAANISDEVVSIPGSPTTQVRFTADVPLSLGDPHKENLDTLKSAGIGSVTYVNGKYRVYAGAYDTPTITIGEDEILGPVTVATHPQGEALYNLVSGTFFDDSRDWSQTSFPSITNSSYETEDGGQYPRVVSLAATRTSYRAQRIGMVLLRQSRNKTTVRLERLSPKAMNISQHETFMLTIAEYGWSSKVFRCTDWEWLTEGYIAITAKEESSSAYTDPLSTDYASPITGIVATPQYDQPDAPTGLVVTPRVQSVHISWTGSATKTDQVYNVYEYTASTPFASATKIWSGKATAFDNPLTAGQTRYYWVTATLNGQESSAYPSGTGVTGVSAGAGSVFVARGNCVVGDAGITKVGGSSAWDSDVYSIHTYSSCHVVFKANETTTDKMLGLSTNPGLNQSYTSIDSAFQLSALGTVYIYESGTVQNGGVPYATYTPATECAITYDGTNTRYYVDRVLVRGPIAGPGLTFGADSSFYTPGGGVNSLIFGPGTNLEVIDTPQISVDATSDLANSQPADSSVNFPLYSSGSTFADRRSITSVAWTNSTSQSVEVEVSYSGLFALAGSNPTGAIGQFAYGEYDTGGGSTTDGADALKIPTTDYVTRSGSIVVTVLAGVTINARLRVSMIGPAGTFDPANVNFSGVSLSIKARKR